MSERGGAEGWQVSLLMPHPSRTAVLVAEGTCRLPTFEVPHAEPTLPQMLAGVRGLQPATTPVLRTLMTSPPGAEGESVLVEFDAVEAQPPDGYAWYDLEDPAAVGQVQPELVRPALVGWRAEQFEGWDKGRPPWSLPGWHAEASAWMVEQLELLGRPATSAPRQHQLWGVSVLLRAATDEGDAFMKCSADTFRDEGRLTRALSGELPGLLPDVLALDTERGWMLMDDLGAQELGEQDESLWHEGMAALARLQRSWLGRAEELTGLGVPTRPLAALADRVDGLGAELATRMPAELRERWLVHAPELAACCRRLDALGPGPSLAHGDFHPWNVAFGPQGARIFDLTDVAISHPFVDLATYVLQTKDGALRRSLLQAYIDAWSGETELSEGQLREAAELGLVVGALYQVQTYLHLLPTLTARGAADGLADADLDWMNRSITRLERGLDSPT